MVLRGRCEEPTERREEGSKEMYGGNCMIGIRMDMKTECEKEKVERGFNDTRSR